MSAFLGALDARVLDDAGPRPTLELLAPLVFDWTDHGTVTVPVGFRSDGASIPRSAMSITGWPGVRAAVVHDWLLAAGVERAVADEAFAEALACCGVDEGTAEIMYHAVRLYSHLVERPRDADEERVGA